jgi:hypothetical protein
MDLLDLISNIGSNLSLFIGISFISFAEIVELLIEIFCIFFENKRPKLTSPLRKVSYMVYKINIKRHSF